MRYIPGVLSDQHGFFEERGWVVLRAVVSAERLIRMKEAFDRVLAPHIEQVKSLWQVPGMCRQDEILLTHFYDGLGEIVADLLRADGIQLPVRTSG